MWSLIARNIAPKLKSCNEMLLRKNASDWSIHVLRPSKIERFLFVAVRVSRNDRPPSLTMFSMADLFPIVRRLEISILDYCAVAIVFLRF
jgi:hypothetical protein